MKTILLLLLVLQNEVWLAWFSASINGKRPNHSIMFRCGAAKTKDLPAFGSILLLSLVAWVIRVAARSLVIEIESCTASIDSFE